MEAVIPRRRIAGFCGSSIFNIQRNWHTVSPGSCTFCSSTSGTQGFQFHHIHLCLFRLWLVCLCWVFVPARAFFPLVVASRGYSLVAVSGLLFAVASVAVEHGLWGAQASVVAAPGFQSTDSIVVAHGRQQLLNNFSMAAGSSSVADPKADLGTPCYIIHQLGIF